MCEGHYSAWFIRCERIGPNSDKCLSFLPSRSSGPPADYIFERKKTHVSAVRIGPQQHVGACSVQRGTVPADWWNSDPTGELTTTPKRYCEAAHELFCRKHRAADRCRHLASIITQYRGIFISVFMSDRRLKLQFYCIMGGLFSSMGNATYYSSIVSPKHLKVTKTELERHSVI